MPARLRYFDMAVTLTPPSGHFEPLPLTLGPNWQPGDIRILMVSATGSGGGDEAALVMPMSPDPPTGFTPAYAVDLTQETLGVYWRRLVSGDVDSTTSWPKPPGWQHFVWATMTVRGVDPAVNPVAGRLVVKYTVGGATASVTSVSVPAAGTMALCLGTIADPEGLWPSWPSAMGVPTGWTHLVATEKSGINYDAYNADPNILVAGKSYAGSGSTGAVAVPVAPGSPAFTGLYAFVQPAPDVTSSGGTITSTGSVGTPSSSSATDPVSVAAPITATASLGTPSNPLHGYWISDPYLLDGYPVAGSIVRWTETLPTGSTVTVETSLNNKASWDVATNGAPIPRLRSGDTTTRQVLSRVTFTRQSPTGGLPTIKLEVRAATTHSEDELLPTFYGAVDKTKTKITAGSSGGSGSSGGGAGVTARGGGMHGGGPVVNVHATDPSRLIKLAEWEQPYIAPTALSYDQILRAMVLDRHPSQVLFNQVSTEITPGDLDSALVFGLDQGGDPWQDIKGVATAIGHEALYDTIGAFCSRPVPDPRLGIPVWTFDRAIIESTDEIDDSLIVNGYVIKGESTSSANPVMAFAFNTDPASKFNIDRIGKRIKRLTFPLAKSVDQCQAIANALLFNSMGLSQTVTIRVPAHPGLVSGDVVRIDSPPTGVIGNFLIQGYQLPDSPTEDMQITCFRQTDNPDA